MIRLDELVERIDMLQLSDLEDWIGEKLVEPRHDGETFFFTDAQCARVRLICSLRYELEIDADTLPVVLSLIDQLYDTRQRLRSLTAAITMQDKFVQSAIIAAIPQDDGTSAAEEA